MRCTFLSSATVCLLHCLAFITSINHLFLCIYVRQQLKDKNRQIFLLKLDKSYRKNLGSEVAFQTKPIALSAVNICLLRGFQLQLCSSTPQLPKHYILVFFSVSEGVRGGFVQYTVAPVAYRWLLYKYQNIYNQLKQCLTTIASCHPIKQCFNQYLSALSCLI